MQNEMETIQQKILKCETEFRGTAKMWNAAILGRLKKKKKEFHMKGYRGLWRQSSSF